MLACNLTMRSDSVVPSPFKQIYSTLAHSTSICTSKCITKSRPSFPSAHFPSPGTLIVFETRTRPASQAEAKPTRAPRRITTSRICRNGRDQTVSSQHVTSRRFQSRGSIWWRCGEKHGGCLGSGPIRVAKRYFKQKAQVASVAGAS